MGPRWQKKKEKQQDFYLSHTLQSSIEKKVWALDILKKKMLAIDTPLGSVHICHNIWSGASLLLIQV